MSSLKDALIRVSRVARNIEQAKAPARPPPPTKLAPVSTKYVEIPKRERISRKELLKHRKHLRGFQKKRFQKFLQELNMPGLKIFDEDLPPYDSARAEANLAAKSGKDRASMFSMFLSERVTFNRMLDFLVELTPLYLKSKETVTNPLALQTILKLQDEEYRKDKYNVPRYHFHEVPPFPEPLTKESFREYIYFITHVNIPYRNSSSLLSGIIPEILLYTHLLLNEKFKDLRSAETFNYLIKYFGHDKFQASFAKELLLVMAADGKQPNLETINQLIKICRVHSKRRSLVSSYVVVLKYLNLVKRMGLSVNLTTWTRIYECITNIFLREAYVNKMASINLPILSHMCVRILEDFCQTTNDTQEVIDFLCNELRRPGWRELPRLAEKVVLHIVTRAKSVQDLEQAFALLEEIEVDESTINAFSKAVFENEKLSNRTLVLLTAYTRFEGLVNAESTNFFLNMIKTVSTDSIEVSQANFILRCLIHEDAVKKLNLPVEFSTNAKSKKTSRKIPHFPYPIPNSNIHEHYRIMKRLTGDHLTNFEARVIHHNSENEQIPITWDPLTDSEKAKWGEYVSKIRNSDPLWRETDKIISDLDLQVVAICTPLHLITGYTKLNAINTSISRDISLVQRLQVGLDEHLKRELEERNIHSIK